MSHDERSIRLGCHIPFSLYAPVLIEQQKGANHCGNINEHKHLITGKDPNHKQHREHTADRIFAPEGIVAQGNCGGAEAVGQANLKDLDIKIELLHHDGADHGKQGYAVAGPVAHAANAVKDKAK